MTEQHHAPPRQVVNESDNKVMMSNFLKEIEDPDEDYAIFALQALQKHLETTHVLVVPPGAEKMFLNKLLNKLQSKNDMLINEVFKLFSLLIKYFSPAPLSGILEGFIDSTRSTEYDSSVQVLTIFKDNLTLANTFSEERNNVLFEVLFKSQKNELLIRHDSQLIFLLELFSSVYQNLGIKATAEDNEFILDKIKRLLINNRENDDIISPIVELIKSWSRFSTPKQIQELIDFTKTDDVKDSAIPFDIITALAAKAPKTLTPYLDYAVPLLTHVINETNDFFAENEPTDEVVLKGSTAINAIANIVDAFPEQCKGSTDEFFTIAFNYITFGVDTIQNANEDDSSDDEIEFSDDDGLVIDEDMAVEGDDAIGSGNSTWQLRKASINLLESLLDNYPEEFFSYFLGQYEDFNTIIQDSDIGVQIDALNILSLIYKKYTNSISSEITDLIVATICSSVNLEQQKSVLSSLNALLQIIPVVGAINNDNAKSILTTLTGSLESSFANQAYRLLLVILKYNKSEEVIDQVCNLLISTGSLPLSYIATADEVSAEVYTRASKVSDSLIALNKYVISTASKGLECVIAALPTLAVFIAAFPGAESTNESIAVIKNSFAKAMVRKSLLGSLVIIASSPQAQQALSPLINEITECLKLSLKGNDASVQYRALWIIKLLAANKVLSGANLQSVLTASVDLITQGNAKSRALALSNINDNICEPLLAPTTQKLKEALGAPCSDSFVQETVKFVKNNISDKLLKELIEVGETEIAQGEKGLKAALSTAFAIGYSVANTEFASKIGLGTTQFTTLVAGALGTITDISKDAALVDKLFASAVDLSDRATFTAASQALGKCSIGSQSILQRLIQSSEKDTEHISTWVSAYGALAPSCVGHLTADQLKPISAYLLQCPGGSQNNRACAEALSYFAEAHHSFINDYFEASTPLSIFALSIFASRSNPEVLQELIPGSIKLCDPTKPLIAAHAMSILIQAIKYQELIPSVIADCSFVLNCVIFSEEHHIIVEKILDEVTKIDIGEQLRLNALDFLYLIADYVEPAEPAITRAFLCLQDPKPTVVASALKVLTRYVLLAPDDALSLEDQCIPYLDACDKKLKQEGSNIILAPFGTALGTLSSIGFGSKEFLRIAEHFKLDPNFIKATQERAAKPAPAPTSRASVLSKFVSRFNRDLASIFAE